MWWKRASFARAARRTSRSANALLPLKGSCAEGPFVAMSTPGISIAMTGEVMKTIKKRVKMTMKSYLALVAIALGLGLHAPSALAHHGWAWTTGGNIDLTGVIKVVKLGNPHGILKVDVEGTVWTVEVGQPWRNERAGLKNGDLAKGVTIRIIGEPATDASDKRLKAERLFLGDREYVLYPDRD
jgi:hypothetical protein